MNSKILFFITAEYPYGTGETFIENEIEFLAESFEKVILVPRKKSGTQHRPVPSNVLIEPVQNQAIGWGEVFGKVFGEAEITVEFIHNVLSQPLKNKVLLKSVRNALAIASHLNKLQKAYSSCKSFFYSYWLDDAALGIILSKNTQCKVARAHGWDVYFERHPYNYLPLRKFLSFKLDQIFTVSENGRSYIAQRTAHPEKIQVSRLGIINRNPFREGVETNELNVVSISSAIPLKRIHLVGEAVQMIRNKPIQWHHFGDGPLLDQIKVDFSSAVFHGHITNNKIKDILECFSRNSVLINTSTTEGVPVSIMEAMSFGIPCIGTNVGGVSEIIEDGVNGFLMSANPTAEDVASTIQKYFDFPIEEKKQLRLNAYHTWEEKYNAQRNYFEFTNEIIRLSTTRND